MLNWYKKAQGRAYHIEHESFAQAFEEMEGIPLSETSALEEWAQFKQNLEEDNLSGPILEELLSQSILTIYGKGGWHRYAVYGDGRVMFSSMHAMRDETERAKRLGFQIL